MIGPDQLRATFSPLRTDRLLLRAVAEEDLDATFAIHGNPETYRFHPPGVARSRDESAAQLADWLRDWRELGFDSWAVSLPDDGRVIGFGGVARRTFHERPVLSTYYRFEPSAWGHGYATEMAGAAIDLARRLLPELPIIVRTRPGNRAAQSVAEKLALIRAPELDALAFEGSRARSGHDSAESCCPAQRRHDACRLRSGLGPDALGAPDGAAGGGVGDLPAVVPVVGAEVRPHAVCADGIRLPIAFMALRRHSIGRSVAATGRGRAARENQYCTRSSTWRTADAPCGERRNASEHDHDLECTRPQVRNGASRPHGPDRDRDGRSDGDWSRDRATPA